MKSIRFLFSKRKNWRLAFCVGLLLALTVVSTAYAARFLVVGQALSGRNLVTSGLALLP